MNTEEAKLDHWNSVARAYGLPDYSYAVQSGDTDLLRNINATIQRETEAFKQRDGNYINPVYLHDAPNNRGYYYIGPSLPCERPSTNYAREARFVRADGKGEMVASEYDSPEGWRIQKQDVYERLKLNFTIDWLQRQGNPRHLLIADRLKEIICT